MYSNLYVFFFLSLRATSNQRLVLVNDSFILKESDSADQYFFWLDLCFALRLMERIKYLVVQGSVMVYE